MTEQIKTKSNTVTMVVVAIIVAALAFFGGMQYQKSKASATTGGGQNADFQRAAGRRAGGNRGFGGATLGDIISIDNNSITVKLQDGSSKIVNLTDSTTFSKTDTASKTDLKTGAKVAAFGTPNSDGSINAQNIQLNPMFRQGGGAAQGTQPKPTQ